MKLRLSHKKNRSTTAKRPFILNVKKLLNLF